MSIDFDLMVSGEAVGFPVSDVIDHGLIRSIYAHGPNGIPIEFSHNVERSTSERSLR